MTDYMKKYYPHLYTKRFIRKLDRYGQIFNNTRKAYRKSRWLKWKSRVNSRAKKDCCFGLKKARKL